MKLTDAQEARYARHIAMPEIGVSGQQRIKAACIAVVGAGGLGAPVVQYLAASGVGHITLIDHDSVSLNNLQRQILFETSDIGELKVEATKQAVFDLNPEVQLRAVPEKLTAENAEVLLAGHDMVIDGTDRIFARYAASDAAVALQIPYLSGAVIGHAGLLALFEGHKADSPCYRCLFPHMDDASMPRCSENGVFAPLCGMVGSMMAALALHYVVDANAVKTGVLYKIRSDDLQVRAASIEKDTKCEVCG